jgi:Protein of unknown function (DUF2809)
MSTRALYVAGAALIFGVEVLIARGVFGQGFVRFSVGDILVIALIYCALRAALPLDPERTAAVAIACGLVAELLQAIHIVDLLGLREGSALYIMLGTTYVPEDLVMYVIGGLLALAVDRALIIPRAANRMAARPSLDAVDRRPD